MTALVAIETVALALLALLVAGLLRSHAEILRALHDLGVDVGDPSAPDIPASLSPRRTPAPTRSPGAWAADLSGQTPAGDAVALAVAGGRHDTLLAFLSSGCLTCRPLWDALAGPAAHAPGGARVVAVTRGEAEESRSRVAELARGARVPVVMSSEAWDDYEVPGSPYFVHVEGATGRIAGEGTAASWEQIVAFLEDALADGTPRRHPAALSRHRAARRRLARMSADAEREARADDELTAVGIFPGDPRLYPTAVESNEDRR